MPLQLLSLEGSVTVGAVLACCVAVSVGYRKLCIIDQDSLAIVHKLLVCFLRTTT